jgi:hypothetical protein
MCLCQDAADPGEKSTPERKRKAVKEVDEGDRPLVKKKKA